MKLQYKLLLMLILAFGMVVLSEQDCFAIVESKENIPTDIPCYDVFMKNLPDYQTNFIIFSLKERNTNNIRYCLLYIREQQLSSVSDDFHYRFVGNSGGLHLVTNTSNIVMQYMSCKIIDNKPVVWDNNSQYSLQFSTSSGIFEIDPLFETLTVYYSTSDVYMNLNSAEEDSIFYSPPVNVDKLNLYELNLTDLDYNNAVHQFNLAMYTNSVCYDDVMNRYNSDCPYAIFVTDYTRVLTYDSESNMNLQRGAYLLSGYIDYLITDKSFFYYSNHYNRIMTRSGTFLESGFHSYKERYYFNAVYSEDTNDPDYIVWGELNNGELVYTDFLDDFDYAYFVGSNQTIYYAKEKNNGDFKELTSDIRKLGYLNRKEGGNVLDVSLMDERAYYIHNFNFSGGVVHNLYLNSSTYNGDSQDLLNQITITDNPYGVKQDGSNGNSYTSSDDIRDSQFNQGDVTDSTTNEEAKNHTGNSFGALNNKDLDDSNWGILDYLSYWFNQDKNGSDKASSTINQATDTITNKFSFKDNMINNANEIKDFISSTQATHKYYLNINHKYLSGNICIIDLSWYEPYKPTVDAFICAFAYLAFMWHMFCNIPSLIRGSSAGSYVSDISTYTYTGFGRSSSIHKGGV